MLSLKQSEPTINIVLAFLLLGTFLMGCSQFVQLCPLIYDVPDSLQATPQSKYYHNIYVGSVIGGDPAFCHPGTVIPDDLLKIGIIETLIKGDFFNGSPSAKYILSVKLVSISQESEGTFQKASVVMKATLKNRLTGQIVFKDTYETTFAAPHDAAILGMERIRIATETATRQNIEKLIGRLQVSVPPRSAPDANKSGGATNMNKTDLL